MIKLILTCPTDFADLRIYEGGDSGRLDFRISDGSWGTVCQSGFDDDAADVACDQLGYLRSDDVYTYAKCVNTIVCVCVCVGMGVGVCVSFLVCSDWTRIHGVALGNMVIVLMEGIN